MNSDDYFLDGAAESCRTNEPDQGLAPRCGHNSGFDPEKEFSTLPAPHWGKGKGWTYFLRRPDGNIKIGCSARPITRRLGEHRRDLGSVEFLLAVPDAVIGEFATHKRFDHLRIEGEIFRPEPELLAFIEELKGKDMTPFEFQNLRSELARLKSEWSHDVAISNRLTILTTQVENYDNYERNGREEDKPAMERLRSEMAWNMAEIERLKAGGKPEEMPVYDPENPPVFRRQ